MREVALGALVRQDRVLLGLRSRHKRVCPGLWDLPGGLVEVGESVEDALERELREELGVRIERGSTSIVCRLGAGRAEEPVLVNALLVRAWEGTPANAAPEEHDEIGWFDLTELPPLAHEPIRTALLQVTTTRLDRSGGTSPAPAAGAERPGGRRCEA